MKFKTTNGSITKESTQVFAFPDMLDNPMTSGKRPVESESPLSMRRYVFLGNGGSGIADILRRKRLAEQLLDVHELQTRFRVSVTDNDHKFKEAFEAGEFVVWDEIPLGDFLRAKLANPDQFPGLDRFGDLRAILEALQPIDVVINGFRGNRAIGGAGYEYMATMHGDQMVSELLRPALELCGVASQNGVDPNGYSLMGYDAESEASGQLIISQSFSAGGAKGSTAALADIWLLRAKLQEMGITNVRFDSTIYLSESFDTSRQQQKRNQAHTQAFIKELKAVYTRPLPPMPIGHNTVERTPVYTLIKLMNGVDEGGQRVYSQSDVYDIGAATAMLSSFGPIADHFESLIPNIVDDLSWPYIAYSQNCHILTVPVEELQSQFGNQLTHDVVTQHLLRPPHVDDVVTHGKSCARQWLTRHHLTPQNLGRLFSEQAKIQLVVDLSPYQSLPTQQLQKAVVEYEKAKFKAWEREITKAIERLSEELAQSLRDEITSVLNAPELGLRFMTYLFDQDADREISGLGAFLADLKSTLVKRQSQNRNALRQVREHLSRPPKFWQRLIPSWLSKHKRQRWFRLKQRELGLRVMELLLNAQIALIDSLHAQVQGHSERITAWIAQLEHAGRVVAQETATSSRLRQQRPVYETNILSPAEETALFQARQPTAYTLMSQRLSWQWHASADSEVGNWIVAVEADGTRQLQQSDCTNMDGLQVLCSLASRLFDDLDTLDIEQILLDQGRDPIEVLELLKEKSPPLVSVNLVTDHLLQGTKSPGLRREVIVGAPQGGHGFFREIKNGGGLQIVATRRQQKHQIVLLSSLFNINPFALSQSGVYDQSYEELKAAGHTLHIFAESEVSESPPVKKQRRKRSTTHAEPQ